MSAWPPLDGTTRYPFGYGTATLTLKQTKDWLMEHHHPEYVRRLCWWLYRQGGNVGCGGGWRAGGAQPDKPGFAPEGKSFHQDQRYTDGFLGAAAVDLVVKVPGKIHRAPYWSEVPAQGTQAARDAGVHCNVGTPPGGESWHIQPIELDGWGTATGNGTRAAPAPVANYPIKGVTPPIIPFPPIGDDVSYTGHNPIRILDTRKTSKPGAKTAVTVSPHGYTPEPGPDEEVYVVANVTVTQSEAAGHITAWSGEGAPPEASNVNYAPNDTSPKNGTLIVPLGVDGNFKIWTLASATIIVDQVGFITKAV